MHFLQRVIYIKKTIHDLSIKYTIYRYQKIFYITLKILITL